METFPQLEEKVLKFWDKNRIFGKSLKRRKNCPRFVFYDGPPFANGLPHYGHLLAMSLKDVFLRFKNLQGFYVPRRLGWDCHGLPVEYEIEKELKISGKKAIEKYGIARFNQKAKDSVFRYKNLWEETIKRLGRFAEFKDSFATLENSYIESVWWVFKKLNDKGLIYQDFTVQPYCPRCETSLSNFETNQGYKDDVPDPSVFVKFKLKGKKNEYLLAWTTTPWTLPANIAVALGDKINYGLFEIDGEKVWVAEKVGRKLFNQKTQPLIKKTGKQMVGLSYESLFPQPQSTQNRIRSEQKSYRLYTADFVDLEEGTGIVHIAPAYGEDDMNLAKEKGLSVIFSTDNSGRMVTDVARGKFVKEADSLIIGDLKNRGLIWREKEIRHTYPFCWRCDTPLMYVAVNSWFVKVTAIKNELVRQNKKINWQPPHLRDGRFGKWVAGVRDWNLSRKRFWGAPIPIWVCSQCGFKKVIGAFKELDELSSGRFKATSATFNPHRPHIDKVEFKCPKCQRKVALQQRCYTQGKMHRIEDVFDCWFESGSMPYAQFHFPFENKKEFEKNFPADFIAEGLDQTRGWFYTLHVIAVALFGKPAFKNVVVNGMVVDPQGRKLSKRLRNYPEPEEIFKEVGADSLRQYFYASAPLGEDYRFSQELVKEKTRKVLLPFLNTLRFLEMKKRERGEKGEIGERGRHILDKWFFGRLALGGEKIKSLMAQYQLTQAARLLEELISDLSLWYLRRSRTREDEDFLPSLEYFLKTLSKIASPFIPFLSEEIYQRTKGKDEPESVDLTDWPKFPDRLIDRKLLSQMKTLRELVELGHRLRKERGVPVRQPLPALFYDIAGTRNLPPDLEKLLLEELNIKRIVDQTQISAKSFSAESAEKKIILDFAVTDKLLIEGQIREMTRGIQALRKKAGLEAHQKASLFLEIPRDLQDFISSNKKELETKTRTRIIEKKPSLKVLVTSEIKIKGKLAKARIYEKI